MRKAETRKADVLVIEIRHVRFGKILAIDADIHQNAGGAGETPAARHDIVRRTLDHANHVGKGTEETSPS